MQKSDNSISNVNNNYVSKMYNANIRRLLKVKKLFSFYRGLLNNNPNNHLEFEDAEEIFEKKLISLDERYNISKDDAFLKNIILSISNNYMSDIFDVISTINSKANTRKYTSFRDQLFDSVKLVRKYGKLCNDLENWSLEDDFVEDYLKTLYFDYIKQDDISSGDLRKSVVELIREVLYYVPLYKTNDNLNTIYQFNDIIGDIYPDKKIDGDINVFLDDTMKKVHYQLEKENKKTLKRLSKPYN